MCSKIQPHQLISASWSCLPGKQADQLGPGACKVSHTHAHTDTRAHTHAHTDTRTHTHTRTHQPSIKPVLYFYAFMKEKSGRKGDFNWLWIQLWDNAPQLHLTLLMLHCFSVGIFLFYFNSSVTIFALLMLYKQIFPTSVKSALVDLFPIKSACWRIHIHTFTDAFIQSWPRFLFLSFIIKEKPNVS